MCGDSFRFTSLSEENFLSFYIGSLPGSPFVSVLLLPTLSHGGLTLPCFALSPLSLSTSASFLLSSLQS